MRNLCDGAVLGAFHVDTGHSDGMSSDGRHILLIEDDAAVASGIVRGLKRAGFDVELAVDGVSGAKQALADGVALVILDLMLPERDGFEVLQTIRARCGAPVIVVTARLELQDRLKAFELGAVDYLPKPFFHEELLARIQARLGLSQTRSRIIEVPGAHRSRRSPRGDRGERVRLTPTEFALLRYLSERPGRAISRLDLATALKDLDEADPQNVHAHISRLRRKLGPAGALIVTVWGHGYRFELASPGARREGDRAGGAAPHRRGGLRFRCGAGAHSLCRSQRGARADGGSGRRGPRRRGARGRAGQLPTGSAPHGVDRGRRGVRLYDASGAPLHGDARPFDASLARRVQSTVRSAGDFDARGRESRAVVRLHDAGICAFAQARWRYDGRSIGPFLTAVTASAAGVALSSRSWWRCSSRGRCSRASARCTAPRSSSGGRDSGPPRSGRTKRERSRARSTPPTRGSPRSRGARRPQRLSGVGARGGRPRRAHPSLVAAARARRAGGPAPRYGARHAPARAQRCGLSALAHEQPSIGERPARRLLPPGSGDTVCLSEIAQRAVDRSAPFALRRGSIS